MQVKDVMRRRVAAENVIGVKEVHDHLVWIEPISGVALSSAEDRGSNGAAVS